MGVLRLSRTEEVNIVKPAERLIETISDQSVLSYPKRLPMIVPPKLYTNMTNGGSSPV
jgi:DNA-directed RNA polymerase